MGDGCACTFDMPIFVASPAAGLWVSFVAPLFSLGGGGSSSNVSGDGGGWDGGHCKRDGWFSRGVHI